MPRLVSVLRVRAGRVSAPVACPRRSRFCVNTFCRRGLAHGHASRRARDCGRPGRCCCKTRERPRGTRGVAATRPTKYPRGTRGGAATLPTKYPRGSRGIAAARLGGRKAAAQPWRRHGHSTRQPWRDPPHGISTWHPRRGRDPPYGVGDITQAYSEFRRRAPGQSDALSAARACSTCGLRKTTASPTNLRVSMSEKLGSCEPPDGNCGTSFFPFASS